MGASGEIDVKIYYEDTDSLGMVYYANYLKYFERGRCELIESLGRPLSDWNAYGFIFAVFKVSVTYHKPARLNDLCRVETEVVSVSEFRSRLKQQFFRGDELLTEAMVQVVCLDDKLELQDFPKELFGEPTV